MHAEADEDHLRSSPSAPPAEEEQAVGDSGPSGAGEQGRAGPLFLLDGSNIAYRAFFALPPEISTSTGFPTNALYGFALMVIKVLADYRPGAVMVAWDSREKTFRHQEFEAYKAQRKPMPEALAEQWPVFQELAEAFGFVNLVVPGHEADDILATLAREAEAEGRDTFIVTGDRDALQLASEHVRIMANARGVTEVKIYDPAGVEERFGVPPRLIPDLIGLKGDTSDNIPGIPGIGEKTAAQLLAQFGTLESVLEHAADVSGAKRRELLVEQIGRAFV
jgi:DNA polymerase-1